MFYIFSDNPMLNILSCSVSQLYPFTEEFNNSSPQVYFEVTLTCLISLQKISRNVPSKFIFKRFSGFREKYLKMLNYKH